MSITGGLQIAQAEHEEKHETNFDPVISMLADPNSELDLITASSLKGFIFKLDVPPGKSRYKEFTLTDDALVEVTHFALKLVIISTDEKNLTKFNGYKKQTDVAKLFIKEATVQQKIWKETYLTNGGEIAPSVGNVTFLEGNTDIIKFLDLLLNSLAKTPRVKATIEFLIKEYQIPANKDYQLGILLMKNYDQSRTLNQCLEDYKASKDRQTYLTIRQNILIKVLRLALCGYIHLDLHAGNSLNTQSSSVIIDYGRAVSITKGDGNYDIGKYKKYISDNNKRFDIDTHIFQIKNKITGKINTYIFKDIIPVFDTLKAKLKTLKSNVDNNFTGVTEADKITLFKDILKSIEVIDLYTNIMIYDNDVYAQISSPLLDTTFSDKEVYGGNFASRLVDGNEKIDKKEKRNRDIYNIPLNIAAATVDARLVVEKLLHPKKSTIPNPPKKKKTTNGGKTIKKCVKRVHPKIKSKSNKLAKRKKNKK